MISVTRAVRFSLLIGVILALGSTAPVHATTLTNAQQLSAQPKGFTLSPPLQNLILGSGLTEAHVNIQVTNKSGQNASASLSLVDFQALDAFGGVSLDQVGAPAGKYSLAHWMSLPNGPTVSIPNNTTANIPVTISNTKDLAPGGHYGAVVISLDSSQADSSSISLKQKLVSLLFIDKTGGDVYGLQLNSLNPNTLHSVPQDVTMMFKSTGNVHVVPRGYITVTDPHGKVVAKGIINPESTLVMPGTERQFVSILQPVSSSSSKGRYTLTAYYRYENKATFDTKSMAFQVGYVSRTTFIVAAVILVGGLFAYYRFGQYRKRRFYSLRRD